MEAGSESTDRLESCESVVHMQLKRSRQRQPVEDSLQRNIRKMLKTVGGLPLALALLLFMNSLSGVDCAPQTTTIPPGGARNTTTMLSAAEPSTSDGLSVNGSGSACDVSNGGCSHNCTRGPDSQALCSCPQRYLRLVNNGRMCMGPPASTCNSGEFTCANGNCVPMEFACDIDDDCGDGTDEDDTFCFDHQCDPSEFTCANGRCIHPGFLCDYNNDCRDNSDEVECDFRTCEADVDFTCTNSRCISLDKVCDTNDDCGDPTASDEQNCEDPEPCPTEWVRCPYNNICIYRTFVCDGDNDCTDNSDENQLYCAIQPCEAPYWRCPSGRCIPGAWQCDGDDDCGDEADEPDTCGTADHVCVEGFFTCGNGHCIPTTWICDTDDDCGDGSDEHEDLNCDDHSCSEDFFTCLQNKPGRSRCIPTEWLCDGDSDCETAEDEANCERGTCAAGQFSCDNGLCINGDWECDHDNDCGDASDEGIDCEYQTCSAEDQFSCTNGRCIPIGWECDDEDDCRDGSDEMDELCNAPGPTCPPDHFRCTSGQCIPYESACNKVNDCDDESDELHCNIDECASVVSNQCESSCVNTLTSFRCTCADGYVLNADQKTCRDIDECTETPWMCSQLCENLPGSYFCKCAEGYLQVEDSPGSCKHTSDEVPFLVFSNRYYIRRLTVDASEYDLIADDFGLALTMDYDYRDRKLYVVDTYGELVQMNLDGTDRKVILTDNIRGGEGIAVDWVTRKLYFINRYRKRLEVFELDGRYRRTLVFEGMFQPRGLVVDPKHGTLYWTDWGIDAYIGKLGMDGSDAGGKIRDDKIVWPNGLTIDFPSEKLFWCDAHLDFIAYSDLDGSNMHELPGQPGAEVAHPFGLDVFEDWVYWTDWNVKGVFKAKKFSGEEQQLLVSSEHRPFDIRVVHSSLHANMTNPCGENNGGCSHLCLIALNGTTSTCACPDGFLLQSDGVTCYPNCSVQEYRCLDNSKCIPFYWKCDGSEDCADGSDELDSCPERHCDSRRFQCTNQNCTSSVQLCNGQDDCGDNSDEAHCQATTCRDWEFRCNTGICILHRLVCNRNNDCPDGSDEDAEVCAATECTKGYFKCNNGFCIPESWICDFDDDCGDGSDEIHRECQSVTCPTGWFSCRTNYRCVPSWAVCNSRDNCRDNSDEENCETTQCENGEFRCDNHKCIPIRWQCDFEDDCGDGSDEVACTYRECSESEYRCPNDQCIPGRWVCNHRDDCKSAADESSCENHECPSDQFQCASGHCVHEDYRCDGDWDCDDISDEQDCPTRLPGGRYCYASEFMCNNHLCVPRSYQCDGFNDCWDESDESVELCAKNTCDAETHFHCTNQKCLPNWMVCDGFNNCLDGSDENTHKLCDDLLACTDEEYRCGNGNCINNIDVCDAYDDCGDQSDEVGCQIGGSCSEADCHQECTDVTGGGYLCSCSKGYRRNPLDSQCLDIDECQEDNPCVQQCKNTKGGVHCSCITGYVDHEHGDGMGCKADEENRPQMLFSDGDGMRYLDTGTHDYDDVVSNEGRIQAVDVNTMTGAVYWTDSTFRVIKRVRLPFFSSTPSKPEIIVNQYQTDRPVGIAVDWIGGNIYWTDQGVESAALTRARRDVDSLGYDGPRISVGKTDGRYLRVLIKEDMESVGVIAINPRRGLMYWTQAGDNPRIEMAWMDGTHRQTLTTEVVKPTGLVIDFTRNDTVYFCDEKRDMISSMGWDGSGRKVVSQGPSLRNPFQLEVFETNLYWTTRDATPGSIWLNSVLTMNKLGKGVPVVVLDHLANPSGLKLYHKLRYSLQDSNACAESPCSHLCLATPTSYDSSPLNGFTCACPQGDTFEIDSIFNCQGAIVEANTMSPLVNPNCQCANGGTCLFDGSCLCFNEWSGPNCTLSSMQRRSGGAGAAVGVTFFVLVMIALAVVAIFYFMRNVRAKKPEDQIPVAYKEGTTNVDLPLGNVDDPHKDVNGTDLGGNFENPMYGLQTAELQAVGHDDNANNAGPLPEKTGLPPDVVQASPVPPPSKPGEVVVDLPLPAPDSSGPMEEEYRRAAFSPTEEEGDTNMLVTRDEM